MIAQNAIIFSRTQLHAYFIKKKRAERTAYTTQLWVNYSASYIATEKVVRNLNNNETKRKVEGEALHYKPNRLDLQRKNMSTQGCQHRR
jgi:hypothetical protein